MRNLLLKDNAASLAKHNPLTGAYTGTNWASATMRAGCQDHLLHPSRSGDTRVMHGTAISMGAGPKSLRDAAGRIQ